MTDYGALREALYQGNAPRAKQLAGEALAAGSPPGEILAEGLIEGMRIVGEDFKTCELYVPEVLIAARAMKAATAALKPHLVESGVKPLGVMVIGTVRGDLHDIGKNLVVMMAEGAGLEVVDIGVDASAAKFLDAVTKHNAKVVGMSALLTTTMVNMREAIDLIRSEADLGSLKIIVGGAPVTQQFAEEVGADGYAPDAASAAEKAKELLGVAA